MPGLSDDRLSKALREVAREDSALEAPAALEARLVNALPRRRAVWAYAAAAAVFVTVAAAARFWPAPAPKVVPIVVRQQDPKPAGVAVAAAKPKHPAKPREKVVTTFYALPYADPIQPDEAAEILHVRLPRSALASLGIPVNPDRWGEQIDAEVVIGQDGQPRALRFVPNNFQGTKRTTKP